jgi:hypothetical protein
VGFGGLQMTVFKNFRIEGYSAYGTKDGNFKYNIGLSTRVSFLIPGLRILHQRCQRDMMHRKFKLYDPALL